jgi:hypothetical protein
VDADGVALCGGCGCLYKVRAVAGGIGVGAKN